MGADLSAQRNYERELEEWEAICREMSEAETAALAANVPRPCDLAGYWLQQCVGICCEVPLRTSYHAVCTGATYICCCHACGALHAQPVFAHHVARVSEYWYLAGFLLENLLLRPTTPWYVYYTEVSLIRPPKPEPPPAPSTCNCCSDPCKDSCGAGECECECDCTCERVLYLVNRQLRSLLCTFSGCHACHPAAVCGPCPCCTWDSTMQPARQHSYMHALRGCSCAEGLVCESSAARFSRWDGEYEAARQARTAAFYRARDERGPVLQGLPVHASVGGSSSRGDYVKFVDEGERAAAPPVGLVIERGGGGEAAEEIDSCCSDRCQGLTVTAGVLAATGAGCAYAAHVLLAVF